VSVSDELFERLRQAFLGFGYEQATMSGLARACGLTRRALYHHFSNKEEAFRHVLTVANERTISAGLAAARDALREGGNAAEVLTVLMDTRYGEARRALAASPHALEINDQAFRRAGDVMNRMAAVFQDELTVFLEEMRAAGRLRLKAGFDAAMLAQLLADGARGVNQARPPIAADRLVERYRAMNRAILFGAAEETEG
jgi:AcrR family transcriptional regulator